MHCAIFNLLFINYTNILPKTDIEIIVPCYNPQPNWSRRFYNGYTNFARQFPNKKVKLTLVNDGTTNGLVEEELSFVMERIGDLVYLPYEENQGKGYAVRYGVKQSTAPLVLLTDIDFPYRTSSMVKLIESIENGSDIVTGFRDNSYYEQTPLHRKIVSKSLRWLLKNALRLPVTDSQCGLKGFNSKGRDLFMRTTINRFLYDLEFLVMACRKKEVKLDTVLAYLRDDVEFTSMSPRVLLQEAINFLIVFRRSWI